MISPQCSAVQCALAHTEISAHYFFHSGITAPLRIFLVSREGKMLKETRICMFAIKIENIFNQYISWLGQFERNFWAKLPVCRKTDEKETFVCLPSSIILTLPTLFRLLFAEIFIQSSILFQNLLVQTENPLSF